MKYETNAEIARRVFRALKTPSDDNPRTDPILAFRFRGKDDFIMMRCNKTPEISVKGKNQTAGEVKFFAYSDFANYSEEEAIFALKDDIEEIELYRSGGMGESRTFGSWLKLPYLVYHAVRGQSPSMQNFIVEAIKSALREQSAER
jgi:hypothetical protein